MLKKFTLEDFKEFPQKDGYKICPLGDYTNIKNFDSKCVFADGCHFETGSLFGKGCRFGKKCTFKMACAFDSCCEFEAGCVFDLFCEFMNHCIFREKCVFAETEYFNNYIYFGEGCRFGRYNHFGVGCMFGGVCECAHGALDRVYVLSGGPGVEKEVAQFWHLTNGDIIVLNEYYDEGNVKEYKKWLKDRKKDPIQKSIIKAQLAQIKMVEKIEKEMARA